MVDCRWFFKTSSMETLSNLSNFSFFTVPINVYKSCLAQTTDLFDLVNRIDNTYFGEGILKNYKEDRETLFLLLTFSTGWGLDDSLHSKLGIAKPRFDLGAKTKYTYYFMGIQQPH